MSLPAPRRGAAAAGRGALAAVAAAALLVLSGCSSLPGWAVVQGRSGISDHQHFTNVALAAPRTAAALPVAPAAMHWPGERSAQANDQWLAQTGTVALVVVRRGEVVFERYYNQFARDSIGTSFSAAKSVVSALLGMALADGAIASVDDPITRYLPELRGNDERFAHITLAHLLSMRSGIAFAEQYGNPWSEAARFYLSPSIPAEVAKLRIATAPNQAYRYSSGDTQLLALAVQRAVGEPLARYAERRLWQPLGAEFDASWSLDSAASATAKGFCCLNARAIDYARLGLLFLNEGRGPDGRQIVPADWVRRSTAAQSGLPGADPAAQANAEAPRTRHMAYYGWQWRRAPQLSEEAAFAAWSGAPSRPALAAGDALPPPGADFYAQGLYGQFIYVAPDAQTVVVRLGRYTGNVFWPAWLGQLTRLNR